MEVEIVDSAGLIPDADHQWLRAMACRACGVLGATGRLSVAVVDDARMSAAHMKFSGIEGTTDVLTFDLSGQTAPGQTAVVGEITIIDADLMVCADEARRQSQRRGLVLRQELLLYIVHGVLHCLGHDDHDDAAYAKMHAREDDVMRTLGLPAAFAAGEERA